MRGDRPHFTKDDPTFTMFTPHARGSTFWGWYSEVAQWVYPACAGIDPSKQYHAYQEARLPRMRGDRPWTAIWRHGAAMFTPHARGSTSPLYPPAQRGEVYPACAGIDPCSCGFVPGFLRLPRMRGDRPSVVRLCIAPSPFTPHARGSTLCPGKLKLTQGVYPACAGIDRRLGGEKDGHWSLPRMRGDRPFA